MGKVSDLTLDNRLKLEVLQQVFKTAPAVYSVPRLDLDDDGSDSKLFFQVNATYCT